MPDTRYRVLLVSAHPTQYGAPLFRQMAQHPRLDVEVAFCSLQGAESGFDPGFGREVAWDVPLLEGYPWRSLPNRSPRPRLGAFFGLINPGLWNLVRTGGFDAVVSYVGYNHASFWILAAAAKFRGKPLLFGTDAASLQPRSGKWWKVPAKKLLLPAIFRLADVVTIYSAAGRDFIRALGIPDERIVLTPFVVNNDWWISQAARVDRAAVRRRWRVPESTNVAVFCAKLQPWKRPQDALRAFARSGVNGSYLVFAGDGPLREKLEVEARALGIDSRVRFLGFVNQSELPSVYCAADLLLLPSEYDPCPVVVCEAMLCGCPVALSDAIRGRFDLVHHGKTGFIYPCGDLEALKSILREAFTDRGRLRAISEAASRRMETWSFRENIAGIVQAVGRALEFRASGAGNEAVSRV